MSCVSRRDKTAAAGLESRRAGERIESRSRKGASIYGDSYGAAARDVWVSGEHSQAISELHWRRVDQARLRKLLRERDAGDRAGAVRDSTLECCRHRQGARRSARGEEGVGQDLACGTRSHPGTDRAAHGRQPGDAGNGRDVGQRQADPRNDRCRPAAGDRSLSLLRRLHSRSGGRDLRAR